MKKASSKTGSVRIIAGKHRGRKLPVLMADGLRPTTDRVKETLFNWLMPYIQSTRCLDCFSGSGSLGFEALSRGANHVDFVELNKLAATQLKQNVKLLSATNAVVTQTNCLDFLKNKGAAYDVIFIDPPFRQQLISPVCELLCSNGWLNSGALIYLECESEQSAVPLPTDWLLLKEKIAGQVSYRLYQQG